MTTCERRVRANVGERERAFVYLLKLGHDDRLLVTVELYETKRVEIEVEAWVRGEDLAGER